LERDIAIRIYENNDIQPLSKDSGKKYKEVKTSLPIPSPQRGEGVVSVGVFFYETPI